MVPKCTALQAKEQDAVFPYGCRCILSVSTLEWQINKLKLSRGPIGGFRRWAEGHAKHMVEVKLSSINVLSVILQRIRGKRTERGGTRRRGLWLKTAGEKLESPLGCSCQDSREADIIHLISSYKLEAKQQNPRVFFLLNWAEGAHRSPPRLCRCFVLPSNSSQIVITGFVFFHSLSRI